MVFYLPILLMILGTTTYHIAQKSVPTQLNPLFSLTLNYLTALVGTVLLVVIGFVFFREHLTAGNMAGIVLCLVGLGLITRH